MYSQIRNISIACIILIAFGGLFQKATAATEEEMRAAMQGMLDAFNAHDVAQMSSYWTEDIVYDFVAQPPPMNGKDQATAFLEGLFEGLPDFHGTQTRILVSGNIMVTEAAVTGTHLGELLGIPATGHSLQSRLLQIWEFEGDKVKWFAEYLDMASSLIQLGVMPAPEPPELVPSFTLPDAERTGLTSLEAAVELDALWDAHDLSGCAKGIHPDAEILMIPLGVPIDREGFIALSELEFLGFSDLRWQPVRSIDMGDGWVVTEIVSTGTHDGPYFGIPATGRSIMVRAGVLRRFDADGLLTNLHCYYDNMTILQQLTDPLPVPEDLVVDQITSPSLEGNLLGDPAIRNMVIYLPPGYETSDKDYPVVYLMPGLGATERWWACGEFSPAFSLMGIAVQNVPEEGFAGMIDGLIADGKMRPMIIVMPDISTAYGGSFCVNSALNGNHEDYIVNDIIPYIDANYRTLPSRDSRGIAGHCMGGYAAMYLSMRHPDVFGAVASHSGTLLTAGLLPEMQLIIAAENPEGLTLTGPDPAKPWTSTLYLFSAAFSPNLDNPPFYVDIPFDENVQLREEVAQRWAAFDLLQIFPDHISALASLRGIYLDAGDKDELGEQLIAQAFSEALSAAAIEHQIEIFDGAHMDKLYTQLAVSLNYLSDALGD